MPEFKSLIIFDSETTSMPHLDHNTTKITELAFLGCEVKHIANSKDYPRVLHKLVLCFNPMKPISNGASEISGLNNELLQDLQPFSKEDVEILHKFVTRLPPPVCIIAHNGDKFDFPILRRMLLNKNDFPDDVYCADSIKAFRELYPNASSQNKRGIRICQTTPTKQRTTPKNQINYKVCKELFPDHENFTKWASCFMPGGEESNLITVTSQTDNPNGYSMQDMYYFFFGANFVNSHRAEEDAKALLGCIWRSEGFLKWVNENAIPFNRIPPLI